MIPVHGKFGSLAGFHIEKNPGGTFAFSAASPPTCCNPMIMSVAEPRIRTIACNTSV